MPLIVFDAGERLRSETFFGEEIEAGTFYPIVNERIGFGVASETRVQSFLENFIELGFQCEDVADARRGGRHPFGLLLFELKEIEVVAAILLFLGAGECFFGNCEQREAGWKCQRFLGAGEHDVDAERVHVDLHRGEG